jgi:long-chain acyl-CoA synthetase
MTGTYNERFQEIVGRLPDHVVFRNKVPSGYQELTYRDLHRRVMGVASGLVARGLQPGTRVAILSENRPEWVVAYLGIYFAGGTAVPLDVQISPTEWRRLLDDSESKLVFVSAPLMPQLEEALSGSPARENIVCFDPPGAGGAISGLTALTESGRGSSAPLPECRSSDVVVIIYTSGTTGKPKGVMLTQENIVSMIRAALACIRGDENDIFLCLLPLHHVFASVVNVLVPMHLGAQVCFVDTLKRSEILEALEEAGITIMATVPQFFYLFHRRIEEELAKKPNILRRLFRLLLFLNRLCMRVLGLNLGKVLFAKIHATFGSRMRLFVSGGSSFDQRIAQDFYDFGFTILQGYGLTETSGPCAVTRVESNVVGSVGSALPGVDIRILDPNDEGIGEILIRGPLVMKGYYKNPEATAEVIWDGWFHSGDLGRIDNKRNLFITGRKKEVIVLPTGKNIYPDELETHYEQCPYIGEIAVLGIANPESREKGERLHAVIVPDFDYLKKMKIANAREIIRFEISGCSNRLPPYKRLMSYQIQKEPLPRTTTRKVKRLELKRLIETGQLRESEAAKSLEKISKEDQEILDSPTGQEVRRCLRENYRRQDTLDPEMNLELDLGFDSMERVEFLASLEQSLGIELPEQFGAEIYSLRDLIMGLEEQTSIGTSAGPAARQSWDEILSAESLSRAGDGEVRFTGPLVSTFRYALLRLAFVAFRTLLGMEIHGRENLPKQGSFLICPNHMSYLDPFVLLTALPFRVFCKLFFVGASEYFETWFMRLIAKISNIFPVDPDSNLLRSMKFGARGLRAGHVLCIFPEGARSIDGEVMEFKKGAAILSRGVGVPMIPVGIQGTYEVWPRDSQRFRLHKVKIHFGEPLQPSLEADSYDQDTQRLRASVAELAKQT